MKKSILKIFNELHFAFIIAFIILAIFLLYIQNYHIYIVFGHCDTQLFIPINIIKNILPIILLYFLLLFFNNIYITIFRYIFLAIVIAIILHIYIYGFIYLPYNYIIITQELNSQLNQIINYQYHLYVQQTLRSQIYDKICTGSYWDIILSWMTSYQLLDAFFIRPLDDNTFSLLKCLLLKNLYYPETLTQLTADFIHEVLVPKNDYLLKIYTDAVKLELKYFISFIFIIIILHF